MSEHVYFVIDSSLLSFLGAMIGGAISGGVGILLWRYKESREKKQSLVDNAYRPWLKEMKERELKKINA